MAAIPIIGKLSRPDGTGINGLIKLKLNVNSVVSVAAGGPLQISAQEIRRNLVNGQLSVGTNIWGNDSFDQTDTYYDVEVMDSNANRLFYERWLVTGSALDIGDGKPVVGVYTYLLLMDVVDNTKVYAISVKNKGIVVDLVAVTTTNTSYAFADSIDGSIWLIEMSNGSLSLLSGSGSGNASLELVDRASGSLVSLTVTNGGISVN